VLVVAIDCPRGHIGADVGFQEITPILGHLTGHASNNDDEQQIEGVFLVERLDPGPHVLTVDARGTDGTTAGSGRFDCLAATFPDEHGCSVVIEEFAV
jgi:hypothetical protein